MKEVIIQRIRLIMEHYKIHSVESFAKRSNVNVNTLRQQLSGIRSISLDTILSIVGAFECISPKWLLTGEGSMLQSEDSKAASDTQSDVDYWRDRCMNAEREAERLRGIIEGLRMAMGINTSVQDSSSKVVG